MQALRWWKGIQKCRPLSFFWTSTTALHYALWLGQIIPECNISSTNAGGICLKHSLNGVSSVTLITCLVEWVQPSSLGCREKTSWYLAKRDWAEAPSLGGQDSNPLRSNSSSNFSCLCFMVSLGTWRPGASSNASIKLVCTGTLVPMWLQLLSPLGPSSSGSGDMTYLFFTTTATFLMSLCNSL